MDHRLWPKVKSTVNEGMFYLPAHKAWFRGIKSNLDKGRACDPVTMPEALGSEYERLGGELTLIELCQSIDHPSKRNQYIGIISDLAAFRSYRDFAAELASRCDDHRTDPAEVCRFVAKSMTGIESSRPMAVQGAQIGDVLDNLSEKPEPGCPTGFEFFDSSNWQGGLAKGEPSYCGAMTGVGKSVFGVQVARHVASSGGNVLFGTFELKQKTVTRRLLCQICGYRSEYEADQNHEGEAWRRAFAEVQYWGITFFDPERFGPGFETVEAFCDYAERSHDKTPFDLIVCDYAQILGTRQKFNSDLQRHEHIAQELRLMAKRTDAPVLVLAQAIRDGEEKGRLRLRNAREYENGANAIFLIDRREATRDTDEKTTMVVDKNRDGKRMKKEVELVSPHGYWRPTTTYDSNVYRGGD